MREIKFRAWDKERKVMLYDSEGEYPFIADEDYIKIKHDCILFADAPDMGVYGGGEWSAKKGEFEITQYTGLKDRNGKEIYEGDIAQFKSTLCGDKLIKTTVEFNSLIGSFIFEMGGDDGFWRYDATIRDLEVIGNTYENPELMEK